MDAVGVKQFLTEIKGYGHAGEGVGDYLGKPVFIPLAARGEVVRFSISEEKKNYAKGCLVEVVRTGPWRAGLSPGLPAMWGLPVAALDLRRAALFQKANGY